MFQNIEPVSKLECVVSSTACPWGSKVIAQSWEAVPSDTAAFTPDISPLVLILHLSPLTHPPLSSPTSVHHTRTTKNYFFFLLLSQSHHPDCSGENFERLQKIFVFDKDDINLEGS